MSSSLNPLQIDGIKAIALNLETAKGNLHGREVINSTEDVNRRREKRAENIRKTVGVVLSCAVVIALVVGAVFSLHPALAPMLLTLKPWQVFTMLGGLVFTCMLIEGCFSEGQGYAPGGGPNCPGESSQQEERFRQN